MPDAPLRGFLSFCLFGSDPRYCQGALRNAALAPIIYPGWRMLVYTGDGVPATISDQLTSLGVELRPSGTLNPMLARFLAASDTTAPCFLSRDTDSRLNQRERLAVTDWLASHYDFHTIRDHPGHCVALGGGLWGGRTGILDMPSLISTWTGSTKPGPRNTIYNNDQLFLRDMIWPLIQHRTLAHDFCTRHIFRTARPFPATFTDLRFVGEIFDADDQPDSYGWPRRLNWLTTP